MITWGIDPSLLLGTFASDVHQLLDTDSANWYVTYEFHDRRKQATLFTERQSGGGEQAAPPGKYAVDITLAIDGKGNWDFKNADWRRIVEKVDIHPRLHIIARAHGMNPL